ncbi:MAG: hypothetical protein M3552_09055 [Planctomycetota bacterium]|nr:hypothetical protein [Planctomycetota bacterium]
MPDSNNTVRLHRVMRAPAKRLYKAFLDAAANLPRHVCSSKQTKAREPTGRGNAMAHAGTPSVRARGRAVSASAGIEVMATTRSVRPADCYARLRSSKT